MWAQIELKRGGDVSLLQVSNISAGGVFVQLGEGEYVGVRIGERVTVYMHIDDDDDNAELSIESPAEVMRIDRGGIGRGPGFGLMWTSADPQVAATLALILARLRDA